MFWWSWVTACKSPANRLGTNRMFAHDTPGAFQNFFREPAIGGRVHPVQAMDRNRHPSPIGGNATFMGFGVAAPMPSHQLPRCVQATPSFRHLCRPLPEWSWPTRADYRDASIAMKRLNIAFH